MDTHTSDGGQGFGSAAVDDEADVRALLRVRTARRRRAVLRHAVEHSLHARLFGEVPATTGTSPN
ncbi:hypothetical protein AB0469_34515 [Streptomyces sp. NPDC093801]|uniref:hypothetical protein n=1 Tax=Streptomyces sp. NPDC093801 TaxID=3155203 RepID=UPI00344B968B